MKFTAKFKSQGCQINISFIGFKPNLYALIARCFATRLDVITFKTFAIKQCLINPNKALYK